MTPQKPDRPRRRVGTKLVAATPEPIEPLVLDTDTETPSPWWLDAVAGGGLLALLLILLVGMTVVGMRAVAG
ncbi:hypothetical protein [Micromonospora sp. WMMD737]|uniref:hypothetical protein n=1 Tax=Micromonospora sp. WMMD737 TaxID=3404113 RepID=UPI003B955161